jgi:mutual gliding-motility protein MglA
MPHIDYHNRAVAFKMVYYGPGLSGKTTNLKYIHAVVDPERKGDIVILDTEEERTLFFDFFPLDLGEIEGFTVRLNLYTVPGQVYYEASRRLILEGADGIVFVADSERSRLEENLESWRNLEEALDSFGVRWGEVPVTLQYNKRDLPNPIRVGVLEKELRLNGLPVTEAVAIQGKGVLETIRITSRLVIEKFQQ